MTMCQAQWEDAHEVEHFCTLDLGHEGQHYDEDDDCWFPNESVDVESDD